MTAAARRDKRDNAIQLLTDQGGEHPKLLVALAALVGVVEDEEHVVDG